MTSVDPCKGCSVAGYECDHCEHECGPVLTIAKNQTLAQLLFSLPEEKTPPDINFPDKAISIIHDVLANNSHKHAPGAWRKTSVREHLDHAYEHIRLFLYGEDTGEPDLYHALTRLAFAAELYKLEQEENHGV